MAVKFFKYYGSKTHLLNDIYQVISNVKNDINTFVDVFGGSGVVALNLPFKVNWIVYNDLDYYLYKTFKVIQNEELRKQLIDKLEMSFQHREIFNEFKEDYLNDNRNLNDLEIAFRTIYLSTYSYSGNLRTFGKTFADRKPYILTTIERLKRFGDLLRNWIIENLDFKEIIEKYDSPNTFFYLDPPYLEEESRYKLGNWNVERLKELKEILDNIKGYYLLNESEVDFPEVIKVFGEPQLVKEYLNQIINKESIEKAGGRTTRKEGFWCNFKLEKETILNKFLVDK